MQKMSLTTFFRTHKLEQTLLFGYYGGGNYGDELLLEVLQNMFKKRGYQNIAVTYLNYQPYQRYHHHFGYRVINAAQRLSLLKAIWCHKNIVVGGGGIWGLDMNRNVFMMSLLLWISRVFLRKKIYLVGVGYYSSTTRAGHVAAYLVAKASSLIITRDQEACQNFARFQKETYLDKDIGWYSREVDPKDYKSDIQKIEHDIAVKGKTLFITLRRFSKRHLNDFTDIMAKMIAQHHDKHIIVGLLEPRTIDPAGYATLQQRQKAHPQIQTFDFRYNPLAFLFFLKKHRRQLVVISPQFHAILSAHLMGVPFLPLIYDNKCRALLETIQAAPRFSIYELTPQIVDQFIEESYDPT